MAITFIGAGAQAASETLDAVVTGAWPASYTPTANDYALVIVGGRPITASATVPTAPSGYTNLGDFLQGRDASSTAIQICAYRKVLAGGESEPTVTVPASHGSTSHGLSIQTLIFRGVDTTTPEDAAVVAMGSGGAGVNPWTPTGITTANNGAWAISAVTSADDNALALDVGNEQGFTPAISGASYDTILGGDHSVGVAYKEITTAGAVTCPTWNQTVNASDQWAGLTIALRAAAGGGTTQNLSGSACTGGVGSQSPGHSIGL